MRQSKKLQPVDVRLDFIVGDTLKVGQSQNLHAGWITGSASAGNVPAGSAGMSERSWS